MIQVILFLHIAFSFAQSPTCGAPTDYSMVLPYHPAGFGLVIYTFPTKGFAASFTLSGTTQTSGIPDRFDFYILNGSQYHQSPYTWDHVQSCSDLQIPCALNVTCGSSIRTTYSDTEAATNLVLLFVCRNTVGPCNMFLNVTLEGTGPDCAPGCPSYDLGNAVCNPICYNSACQYDGGDCIFIRCSAGCLISNYQNGNCDLGCNNSACNFDGGDCSVPSGTGGSTTSTASPAPSSRSQTTPSPMANTGPLRRVFS